MPTGWGGARGGHGRARAWRPLWAVCLAAFLSGRCGQFRWSLLADGVTAGALPSCVLARPGGVLGVQKKGPSTCESSCDCVLVTSEEGRCLHSGRELCRGGLGCSVRLLGSPKRGLSLDE